MTSKYITLDESFSIKSETCRYSDDKILADYTYVTSTSLRFGLGV
jgi:hypothetical protein